jgi:flagellar motor switch protein FliN
VAETIEYEQFEGQDQNRAGGGASDPAQTASDHAQTDLSRLSDIPMELSVEIGRTHMTVGETLDLRVGSVVALERLAGETADLLVNGSAIARGEVVVVDEQYGLRITEILDVPVEGAVAEVADSGAEIADSDAHDADAPGATESDAPTGEQQD